MVGDKQEAVPQKPDAPKGAVGFFIVRIKIALSILCMPYTLLQATHSDFIIKKSRFIGLITPVAGREQAQKIVQELWQQHPGATHICWALLAGGHSAAVDDGEPGGTAGRPMLEVMRHHDLEGVLAVAVRYYGGIPLGAGGLVRAYTDTVVQALAQAQKIPLRKKLKLCFEVEYALEGSIRRLCPHYEAQLILVEHLDGVGFTVELPQDQQALFEKQINESSQGKVKWLESLVDE